MKKMVLIALAVALASFLLAQIAGATEILTLSDGVNPTVTVLDGGAGDVNLSNGAITWIGSLGVWTLNVTTGLSKPAVGSATMPELDLSSVNVAGSGAGTLSISLSDNGFTYSGEMVDTVGGTLGSGMTGQFFTYLNSSAIDALPGSNSSYDTASFHGRGSENVTIGSGDTLKLVDNITATGASTASWDHNTNVPEPSTLLLLGAGLLGAALFMRKVVA